MPTLNVRLAAILLVSLAVVGGGVHLLHAFQVGRQAKALKDASQTYEDDSKVAIKKAETATNPEEKKAARLEGEKNLTDAVQLLHDYVRLVPSDRGAEIHLGLLYIDNKQLKPAFDTLEDALRLADKSEPPLSPEEIRDARLRLIKDVTMKIGPVDAMKAHLEILLEGTIDENKRRKRANPPEKPQGDAELLDLYGLALVYSRSEKDACEFFQDAIAIAPDREESYLHLANVMRVTLHQEAEADAVMESMIAKNPKSVPAYEKYVSYYLVTGKKDKIDKAFNKSKELLKLSPDDPRGLLLMGRCYYFKQDYDKAEEYLRKGIKASKDTDDVVVWYKLLAETQRHTGKFAQAISTLNEGIKASQGMPGSIELLWLLADVQVLLKDFKNAEPTIKSLRDQGYPAPLVDFLDARIAIDRQNWREAERLLSESVIKGTVTSPNIGLRYTSLVYLAQCYAQTNHDVKDRISALEQATKLVPTDLSARAALAEIYMSQGRMADAIEQYVEATKGPQRDEAEFYLARAEIIYLQQTPETAEKKRDWAPVETLLAGLIARKSTHPEFLVLKAEMLLSQNKPQEAREALEECVKAAPKAADAWLALVKLDSHEAEKAADSAKEADLWKLAARDLDRAEKALGDRVIVRLARGSLALASKDPQINVGEVLKKLGENTGALNDAEIMQLWSSLGGMCAQANEVDLGRDYLRRVADKEPKNLRVRSALCGLDLRAFEKGHSIDMQELDRLIDDVERLGGRSSDWFYGKAIRAFIKANNKDPQLLSEARGYLNEAMKTRADWAPLVVLAGKICELQEEADQALELYTRAVYALGERDVDVIGRTVRLLVPRRRFDEAKLLFDYLEKQKSPLVGEMHQEYIFVKVFRCKDEDIANTANLIEKSVPADSKNYKDLAWQGELYAYLANRLKAVAQKKDPQRPNDWVSDAAMLAMARRSLETLYKAKQAEPQADEVWVALAQVLADIGQPKSKAAELVLAEAERTLQGEKAPMTVGICCELLGRPDKAEEKYKAAVKESPKNCRYLRELARFYLRTGKVATAEPLLRNIIALQSPATLNDTCWARRNLAAILKGRDFEGLRQALALLDENLASNAATTEDKRMKVRYLVAAADRRKENLNDAITGMEDLIKAPDATLEDHFSLGQLYLRKCDLEADEAVKTRYRAGYEQQMRIILGGNHVQPRYVISYIIALMDRKEYEDADRWLGTLEKAIQNPGDKDLRIHFESPPDPFEALRLRAEYLYRRGQYKELGNKADDYVYNLKSEAPNRGDQIHLVAGFLEGFSNRLKADHQPDVAKAFMVKAEGLYESLRSRTAWSGLENVLNKRASSTGIGITAELRAQINSIIDSKVGEARLAYAAFLGRQGRIDESLAVLEQSWDRSQPDLVELPVSAVINNSSTTPQQFARLEKLLLDAQREKPSAKLLMRLGGLYEAQRQYGKAIAVLREVLTKEPKNFQVLNNIGVDLVHSGGNLDEALSMVNQALAVAGPMAAILDSRAMVYIARKEYAKAMEDLSAAINDEGSAEQYFHLAWALSLLERKDEASTAFKTAQVKGIDPKVLDDDEIRVYDRLKDIL